MSANSLTLLPSWKWACFGYSYLTNRMQQEWHRVTSEATLEKVIASIWRALSLSGCSYLPILGTQPPHWRSQATTWKGHFKVFQLLPWVRSQPRASITHQTCEQMRLWLIPAFSLPMPLLILSGTAMSCPCQALPKLQICEQNRCGCYFKP